MVERGAYDAVVEGSTPSVSTKSLWRNWIARETSNLKVAGSSPARDIKIGINTQFLFHIIFVFIVKLYHYKHKLYNWKI